MISLSRQLCHLLFDICSGSELQIGECFGTVNLRNHKERLQHLQSHRLVGLIGQFGKLLAQQLSVLCIVRVIRTERELVNSTLNQQMWTTHPKTAKSKSWK